LLTSTAADTILLVVKTAAAFAPAGQTISAKSALPDFLIPQATPTAKNPCGLIIVSFLISQLLYLKPAPPFKNMANPGGSFLFHLRCAGLLFQQTIEPS
jgi:sorbitol-specific phosphotransferase system component IIBC